MIFQKWDDIPRMRIIHENIPPESVIELQMIVGEKQTLALWTFSEGSEVASHKHPHEQMSFIQRGRFLFRVEGEEEREVGAGEVVVCKSNVEHWLKALEGRLAGPPDIQPQARRPARVPGSVYSGVMGSGCVCFVPREKAFFTPPQGGS